jgi:hypothetical protein
MARKRVRTVIRYGRQQYLRLKNPVDGQILLFLKGSRDYKKHLEYGWQPVSVGMFRRYMMEKGGKNV